MKSINLMNGLCYLKIKYKLSETERQLGEQNAVQQTSD